MGLGGVVKGFIRMVEPMFRKTYVTVEAHSPSGLMTDRNVVITGGSSGMGLSIALKCAAEGAGVVIIGRNEENLKAAKAKIDAVGKEESHYLVRDITKENENSDIVDATVAALGSRQIDYLVNNAGVFYPKGLKDVSESEWNTIFDTNTKSHFFITRQFVDYWTKENKCSGGGYFVYKLRDGIYSEYISISYVQSRNRALRQRSC